MSLGVNGKWVGSLTVNRCFLPWQWCLLTLNCKGHFTTWHTCSGYSAAQHEIPGNSHRQRPFHTAPRTLPGLTAGQSSVLFCRTALRNRLACACAQAVWQCGKQGPIFTTSLWEPPGPVFFALVLINLAAAHARRALYERQTTMRCRTKQPLKRLRCTAARASVILWNSLKTGSWLKKIGVKSLKSAYTCCSRTHVLLGYFSVCLRGMGIHYVQWCDLSCLLLASGIHCWWSAAVLCCQAEVSASHSSCSA